MPYNTSHTTNTHKPQNQTQKKMLASTMQHSTHHHTPTPTTTTTPTKPHKLTKGCVRRSRAGSGHQKKQPPTGRCLLRTQQCAETCFTTLDTYLALCSTQHTPDHTRGVNSQIRKPRNTRCVACPPIQVWLLRKEVIQPHLPVRLPCYDFVPIAGPTFDHSPPTRGLGHGLRVLPTFVT